MHEVLAIYYRRSQQRTNVGLDKSVRASAIQFSKVIGFVFSVVQKEHSEILMFIRGGEAEGE